MAYPFHRSSVHLPTGKHEVQKIMHGVILTEERVSYYTAKERVLAVQLVGAVYHAGGSG